MPNNMIISTLSLITLVLSACSPMPNVSVSRGDTSGLTAVQNCAIGYDLSKQIYDRVVLAETLIVPARVPSQCETYTYEYLRRAGFALDETANLPAMRVDLTRTEAGAVMAIATIGGTLRLARTYMPADTGVFPKGGVSFQTLPKGAYVRPTPRGPALSEHRGR
jgi:hypothetical protein